MKLQVELNPKSIEQVLSKLKKAKYQSTKGTLIKEYFKYVCRWIINKANWYLDLADLGELVKLEIKKGWEYEITIEGAKIINRADKSVFVEFGVGIVGQQNPHPNAGEYIYNKPHTYIDSKTGKTVSTKDENGMWYFWTNQNELDIPKTAIEDIRGYDDFRGEKGKRIIVGTRGTEGVWYAYNAIVDAKEEMKNPNGDFAKEYKKLLERYIG